MINLIASTQTTGTAIETRGLNIHYGSFQAVKDIDQTSYVDGGHLADSPHGDAVEVVHDGDLCGDLVAIEAFLILMYFVDLGHYDYLHDRLNASSVEHILPLGIALRMVWETYPVVPGIILLFLFADEHIIF